MTQESFFSRINEQLIGRFPLVIYRKPGESLIKALLQNESSRHITKDFTESGFVFSPFDDRRESLLIPLDQSEVLELDNYKSFSTEPVTGGSKIIDDGLSGSAAEGAHIGLVKKAIEKLKTGDLDKVVLSRREEVDLNSKEPTKIFTDLLQNYPQAFVYCWFHPQTGIWMGATPETLLSTEGLNFKTMALAGTQKFPGNMDVSWGEKEKLEQQYVTDAILENLKGIKGLKISETFTSQAGGVLHLRTDISGRLRSGDKLEEILRSLHPTPAVCGSPREKAKAFILEEEAYDREYYTGFLGELNFQEKVTRSRNRRNTENLAYSAVKKKSTLFVNLRCMKLKEKKAVIYVGGGITKDSIPEDEYLETVNKSQTMKKVLGE